MRTYFRLLLGAVSVAFLVLYETGMAAACSVERVPLPWVLTTPHFDPRFLPEDVTIDYRKPESWGDGELVLTNPSPTPLYVLAKSSDGFDGTRTSVDMPAGQVATLRLAEDVWSEYRDGRWIAIGMEDAPSMAWTATLSSLGIDTHSDESKTRPDDYVVPQTLQTTLNLLYDDQVVAVPTTIEFALNPAAEPRPAPRIDPCGPPPDERPWLPLLLTIVIGGVGIGGFWWYRMPRNT